MVSIFTMLVQQRQQVSRHCLFSHLPDTSHQAPLSPVQGQQQHCQSAGANASMHDCTGHEAPVAKWLAPSPQRFYNMLLHA